MKQTLVIAALAAAAALAGESYAQEPITLRIGHFLPPQSRTHSHLFVPLAENLAKESGGRLRATVYPGGSLGRNPAQQLQLVMDGVTDITFVLQSYTPGEFPDNSLLELPLLMETTREASIAHQRLFERGLLRGYDKVKVLGLGTLTPYNVHLNFSFSRLEDLKGRKIRVATGIQSQIVSALGGTPVGSILVTQIAESLSRGVIDGTLLGWDTMNTFRVAQVTTHHVPFPLGFTPVMVAMNRAKYEALPPDLKRILDRYSGTWMTERLTKGYETMAGLALSQARKSGKNEMVELSSAERKRWSAALAPILVEWKKSHPNGPALLAALEEELKALRGG